MPLPFPSAEDLPGTASFSLFLPGLSKPYVLSESYTQPLRINKTFLSLPPLATQLSSSFIKPRANFRKAVLKAFHFFTPFFYTPK